MFQQEHESAPNKRCTNTVSTHNIGIFQRFLSPTVVNNNFNSKLARTA
jgi:hypothetical protein